MKLNLKAGVILASVVALGLTSYAVFAKLTASPGYHILNQDPTNAYETSNSTACPGITVPTTVSANTTVPNDGNAIVIDATKAGDAACSTTYTNVNDPKYFCVVGIRVTAEGNAVLSAIGSHGHGGGSYWEGCTASGPVVLLGSGS